MREVWIMGSGPSAKKRLEVGDKIVMNYEMERYPDAKYLITCDYMFSKLAHERRLLQSFKQTRVFVAQTGIDTLKDGEVIQDIKTGISYDLSDFHLIIKADPERPLGRTFNEFSSGYNSGFCGIQLAICLGYDVIHLVGFDLSFKDRPHWNDYMPRDLEKMRKNLSNTLPYFLKALSAIPSGISIISHSKNSPLNDLIKYEGLNEESD